MAVKNPNIKHIKVQGIELDVDMEKLNDPRFSYVIGKLTDDELNEVEKLPWVNRWFDTLLGDNAYKVMCQVADSNGGKLSPEQWNDFFGDVLEAVNAKN
jgi:hypothetical protein